MTEPMELEELFTVVKEGKEIPASAVVDSASLRAQLASMDMARAQEAARRVNAALAELTCAMVPRIVLEGQIITEATVNIIPLPLQQSRPSES